MAQLHLRKYGVQTTINFMLFGITGVDFKTDAVHAAGDTKIMKDEGAETDTTNGFTDEGQGYALVLTAAEMQAARIVVYIVDQGTKVWLDTALIIETYGNAAAQHPFDLGTASSAQTGDNFARLGAPAGASLSADIAAIEAQTDDIGANGAGLTAVPWNAAWDVEVQSEVNDGLVAFFISAATLITNIWGNATRTLTAGTNIVLAKGVGVTGFNDLSAAQVNAEVVDALNVDSYTEPGQTSPPVSASLAAKINYLYKAWRNRSTQTATAFKLYADDGTTVDQKATTSDDTVTFDRTEITAGP